MHHYDAFFEIVEMILTKYLLKQNIALTLTQQ